MKKNPWRKPGPYIFVDDAAPTRQRAEETPRADPQVVDALARALERRRRSSSASACLVSLGAGAWPGRGGRQDGWRNVAILAARDSACLGSGRIAPWAACAGAW